jgi:hypothetical protein
LSKAPCSLIAEFINTARPLLMDRHVCIDRRRLSNILDVRPFRRADCDTDHYLVVEKIRERLTVSKRPVNKMDMNRFTLKKLNEGEIKEKYQVTIKNRFSALEDNGDINRAWDAIRKNINISCNEYVSPCEVKHHKPWFDEEFSKVVDRRKQVKLQWLQ